MHNDDDDYGFESDDDEDLNEAWTMHRGAMYVEDKYPTRVLYSPSKYPGGGISGRRGKKKKVRKYSLCGTCARAVVGLRR
jgi:hypothetical protein